MNKITDELYERFKTNLEKVDGRCVRSSAEDLGKTLAGLMKDLLDRAPFGSKLPRLRVPGTLYTAKGTRAVRRNLRCLRGPAAVFFYSEGCGTCEAEKAAIPAVVAGGMKVFLVDVDALMRGNPSLAEKLLETFDLSSLPFILQTDRKGRITRKYLSLQE